MSTYARNSRRPARRKPPVANRPTDSLRIGKLLFAGILALVVSATLVAPLLTRLGPGKIRWYGTHVLNVSYLEQRFLPFLETRPWLVTVPLRPLAQEIRKYPVVRAVALRKRWPMGLDIYVIERQPYALVQDSEGFKYVDRDGVYFARFQGDLATVKEKPVVRVDSFISRSFPEFWRVVPVLDHLRQRHSWLLEQILWLRVHGNFLIMELDRPSLRVILADEHDYTPRTQWPLKVARRLRYLQQQWPEIRRRLPQGYHEVDLRFQDQIVLRP